MTIEKHRKTTMNQDVFPAKNGDVPFSRGIFTNLPQNQPFK